jgi:hypothetical protein
MKMKEKNLIDDKTIETVRQDYRNTDWKRIGEIKERLLYVDRFLKQFALPEESGTFLMIVLCGKPERWLRLTEKKYCFGRSEEADVIINDDEISRIHCLIEDNNRNWILTDCNSRNSVYVNSEKTLKKSLCDGDIIRIGRCELIFLKNEALVS